MTALLPRSLQHKRSVDSAKLSPFWRMEPADAAARRRRSSVTRRMLHLHAPSRPVSAMRSRAPGAASTPAPSHRSFGEALEEVPTGPELEQLMKLWGRLHDDQTLAEWLNLGQPSTVGDDVSLEHENAARADAAFVQRFAHVFAGAAAAATVDPRRPLAIGDGRHAREPGAAEHDSDDSRDSHDAEFDAMVDLACEKLPQRAVSRGSVSATTGTADADARADDSRIMLAPLARRTTATLIEGGESDSTRASELAAAAVLVANRASVGGVASAEQRRRSRRPRPNLGWESELVLQSEARASGVTESGAVGRRLGLSTANRGSASVAAYGKMSGEPVFIPAEPRYSAEDREAALRRAREAMSDDDDENDASLPRSSSSVSNSVRQPTGAIIAELLGNEARLAESLDMSGALEDDPFDAAVDELLTHARAAVDAVTAHAYSVEVDFWEATQTQLLSRSESAPRLPSHRQPSTNASDAHAPPFVPGRGPASGSLVRIRALLDRALRLLDCELGAALPEPTEEQLRARAEALAEARKAKRKAAPRRDVNSFFSGVATQSSGGGSGGAGSVGVGVAALDHDDGDDADGGGGGPESGGRESVDRNTMELMAAAALLTSKESAAAAGGAAARGAAGAEAATAPSPEDHRYTIVLGIAEAIVDALLNSESAAVPLAAQRLDAVAQELRDLRATRLAHVLRRDAALGEVTTALADVNAVVRAATRVGVHVRDQAVFHSVMRTFVSASRRMQEFARDIARIGEIALLDPDELRVRLERAKPDHEAMVVALLELADAMETLPIAVPRHAQWRRRALDELFWNLQAAVSTLSTLELAGDAAAQAVVATPADAERVRELLVARRLPLGDVAVAFGRERSVAAGAAIAIAARRTLREMGRAMDASWGFSCW
jgi:hypothetical protein